MDTAEEAVVVASADGVAVSSGMNLGEMTN